MCSKKILIGDEIFEDEEGTMRACSLDNEQSQAVVEQNLCQSVREMSQALGVSTATFSH